MSIRATLTCQLKPNQFQVLQLFLKDNLPNVRGFKGNIQVSVLFDEENNELLLDEEWLNVESHLAYLDFISANGILEKLNSFLSTPPKVKHFKKVEI